MHNAGVMVSKVLIFGLLLVACLEFTQGKPSKEESMIDEYADSLIQGLFMNIIIIMYAAILAILNSWTSSTIKVHNIIILSLRGGEEVTNR